MTEPTLPPEELARYADAIVDSCLHLAPGDLFLVRSAPEHRELVVALAEAAYRRGVRHVESLAPDRASTPRGSVTAPTTRSA